MFPYNTETYFQWMEQIAINHVDILHNPDRSASGELAFSEVYLSSDPWDKLDIASFINDIKSKVRYPHMICVGADWEGAGRGQNTLDVIQGSYIILDQEAADTTDIATKRRGAYTKTGKIAKEIAAYIKRYFEVNTHLGDIVSEPTGEKIGPLVIGSRKVYGHKVTFSYKNYATEMVFHQEKFGLLVPGKDSVPDYWNETPVAEDFCDILARNISQAQKECLRVTVKNSDESFLKVADPRTTLLLNDVLITVQDLDGNLIDTFLLPAGVDLTIQVDAGTPPPAETYYLLTPSGGYLLTPNGDKIKRPN